ncbi:hypothetical protein [Erythrobacter tepidarius]|uniref:hypothetical protein n=1 Tax=Erythrobacter tepidarius TaxID=60454 RepID=UPI00130247F7|nr:hypothetical protein [Erythrobacter tepidarius]
MARLIAPATADGASRALLEEPRHLMAKAEAAALPRADDARGLVASFWPTVRALG